MVDPSHPAPLRFALLLGLTFWHWRLMLFWHSSLDSPAEASSVAGLESCQLFGWLNRTLAFPKQS